MDHPIVQELDRQMRERITKELEEKLKTKFIWERWHILSILIALSLICAIFRAELMYVSAFLIVSLVIDTFLSKESTSTTKPRSVAQITGITDVDGEE